MGKIIFIFLVVFHHTIAKAQFPVEQGEMYNLFIPSANTFSTQAIADYVKANCNTEQKRVGAIYNWVINNIRYDTDSASAINLRPDPGAKITEALRRRKGVCENFAAIFADICNKAGLVSFVIDGYTRQYGVTDRSGHTWCAVKLDNKWMLCDPTWDSGNPARTRYYLVNPRVLLETHMPFDPMWQLQHYPISHKQFYNKNYYTDKNQSYFNYTDSIENYVMQDSLQRFGSTARRIEQHGVENILTKNRLSHNKMYKEMLLQDIDASLYNNAVQYLNDAVKMYNAFVQLRNNQFTPALPDKDLEGYFSTTLARLNKAYESLNQLDTSEANLKVDADDLKAKLENLSTKIKAQQKFLALYLQTAPENRKNLFN